MKVTMSVPAKTFLAGEYGVLSGGPGLLINSGPRFVGEFSSINHGDCRGIHPKSPAGLWIRANSFSFKNIRYTFSDPFNGAGGFGASSAQFIFAAVWSELTTTYLPNFIQINNAEKIWKNYRAIINSNSVRPSGADVASQIVGRVCSFQSQPFFCEPLEWNFPEIDFLIVQTGQKVNTHEHLQNLDAKEVNLFRRLGEKLVDEYSNKDWENFCKGVFEYCSLLKKSGYILAESEEIAENIRKNNKVLLVKPCGAKGADTLLVFFAKEDRAEVKSWLDQLELNHLGSASEIDSGLSLHISMENQIRTKNFYNLSHLDV